MGLEKYTPFQKRTYALSVEPARVDEAGAGLEHHEQIFKKQELDSKAKFTERAPSQKIVLLSQFRWRRVTRLLKRPKPRPHSVSEPSSNGP
jgi:hypothetical protein